MTLNNTLAILLFSLCSACHYQVKVEEKNKILHAGPVNSGFGGVFFGLYKDNKYKFCDGDFMDDGCYTGNYDMIGDTILLKKLRKHVGIPSNKFFIRRYKDMDSSYWKWKYPNNKDEWESMRHSDSAAGSTGDIFPLDTNGKIVFDRNNYYVIRYDDLNYRLKKF